MKEKSMKEHKEELSKIASSEQSKRQTDVFIQRIKKHYAFCKIFADAAKIKT